MNTNNKQQQLAAIGSKLGQIMVAFERKNIDPNYDKRKENNELCLARPLSAIMLRCIPITSQKVVEKDILGDSYVHLNFDDDNFKGENAIKIPIAELGEIEILSRKINDTTVKNALDIWEASGGSKRVLFADHAMAVAFVKEINEAQKMKLQRFISELSRQTRTFEAVNKQEDIRLKQAQDGAPVSEVIAVEQLTVTTTSTTLE